MAWKWWQGARVGSIDLLDTSYLQFLDRPETEQQSEIRRLVLEAAAEA